MSLPANTTMHWDGKQWIRRPSGIMAWPIGSVFMAVVNTDPATLLGFGTWEAIAAGRVLVGVDANDTDFDAAEKTFGSKTHTLATGEMPTHTHTQNAHTHVQDSHNQTQNAHTHTQDAHTHTQNAHNHTQDPHSHVQSLPTAQTGGQGSGTKDPSTNGSGADALSTAPTTATNQPATAVNQNATATNQNTTATNIAATATNQNATAVNQNTGGGAAHNNVQPSFVVYMWKRTA